MEDAKTVLHYCDGREMEFQSTCPGQDYDEWKIQNKFWKNILYLCTLSDHIQPKYESIAITS